MRAGLLDSLITIEQPSTSVDAIGQPIAGWSKLADVRASIRVNSGLAQIRAGADVAVVRASVRIRRRSDVRAGMRILHAGTVYEVEVVQPHVGRQVHTDLVCKVVA